MNKEYWDAYLEDQSPAGFDLIRDEVIPQGYYHLATEVLVRHHDGSFLVVQRSWNKSIQPGMFEASASGSCLKGETALQGARRELFEETGILVDELKEISTHIHQEHQTIFKSFVAQVDIDKNDIRLQKEEAISYKWLSKEEFLNFIETKQFISYQKKRILPYLNKIFDFKDKKSIKK